jgi:hypothetical protein
MEFEDRVVQKFFGRKKYEMNEQFRTLEDEKFVIYKGHLFLP